MNKKEALEKLNAISEGQKNDNRDYEGDHIDADWVLLDLIGDEEIKTAFNKINKWYA